MDRAMREEEVFAEALEPRLRDIYSYLRRLQVDAASAEDLAQETILAAWQNLPSLRDHRKLRSWLYTIAHRLYLRHARMTTCQAVAELVEEPAGTASDDPGSDEHLAARAALQALRALPDKYLQPLALVYWEELSYQEAARVLSLPIGTLAWRVHKALKLVRRALAEEGTENELRAQACRAVDPLDEG